jgi:hypothetical protein
MDISYKYIKKYKNSINKAVEIGITQRAHYNEHLCYDYKVIEFLVYSEDNSIISDDRFNWLDKYPVTYFDDINDVSKVLQKYQKKAV